MSSIYAGFPRIQWFDWVISFLGDLQLGGGTLIQECPWGGQNLRSERDFEGTPIHTTWVPLKSIVEHFRALLRDFCFWANFWFSEPKKILIFDALARIKEKRRMDSTSHPPKLVIPEWVWR